jgi:CYTH domain-containing protein
VIDLAIEVAARAHANQVRKGTDIPYITHPFAVALLLCQAGCSEELIMAGILHDTTEDTAMTVEQIREKCGDRVAKLVQACAEPDKSLPWEERKRHTLEDLKKAPIDVKWVACADKLHNIRTIAADYKKVGDEVWKRFNRGREQQEWYYGGLLESLADSSCDRSYATFFARFKGEVEALFGKKRMEGPHLNREIERKFLVKGDSWRGKADGIMVRQGYLSTEKERVVRVRTLGERGFLAIKGSTKGISRPEYEYGIPLGEAQEMLDRLCIRPLLEKKRYALEHQGLTWKIDEFLCANQGLILAEVELAHEEQEIRLPEWVGEEVSHDPRYFNSNLVKNPYGQWGQA